MHKVITLTGDFVIDTLGRQVIVGVLYVERYGDWRDYKNQEIWTFEEQEDKWGYLNNPRWTKKPVSPKDVFPYE